MSTFLCSSHTASPAGRSLPRLLPLLLQNTFLSRAEFQQLLYVAVSGLKGTELVGDEALMVTPPPAVRTRTRQLWTGEGERRGRDDVRRGRGG